MNDLTISDNVRENIKRILNENRNLKQQDFAVPATDAVNTKFLTTAEISERLIYYGNIKRPLSLSRLGVLLSQKGFLSIRKGTPQRRGWIVYERDSEEINSERKMLSKN